MYFAPVYHEPITIIGNDLRGGVDLNAVIFIVLAIYCNTIMDSTELIRAVTGTGIGTGMGKKSKTGERGIFLKFGPKMLGNILRSHFLPTLIF